MGRVGMDGPRASRKEDPVSILTNPVFLVAVPVVLAGLALLVSLSIPKVKEAIYVWPPVWRVVRIFVLLALVYVLVLLIFLSRRYPEPATTLLLAYLAGLIGGLVGAGELVGRYRDAPLSALGRGPSAVYLAINAVAAASAFLLIDKFDWNFGIQATGDAALDQASVQALRVLVAGFGAMALFRSSLFLVRVGDKDVGVGPATVLQVVLNAADSGVDRETAVARALVVKRIMGNVDPDKARNLLPLFCHRLLQSSLSDDEFRAMKNKIDQAYSLDSGQPDSGITRQSKAYGLGLIIMNYMGEDVLEAGVDTLGSEIEEVPELGVPDDGSGAEAEESHAVLFARGNATENGGA